MLGHGHGIDPGGIAYIYAPLAGSFQIDPVQAHTKLDNQFEPGGGIHNLGCDGSHAGDDDIYIPYLFQDVPFRINDGYCEMRLGKFCPEFFPGPGKAVIGKEDLHSFLLPAARIVLTVFTTPIIIC